MEKQKQASKSTNYRFEKVGRKKDIQQFLHFRNQYQNCVSKQQIEQLKQVFQHGICGKNKDSHLVVVDRIGCVKINQVNKVIDEETLIGYFNQRLINISEKQLEQKQQVLWVIDLQGKIMQLASKKVLNILNRVIENLQHFFPEILYKIYLTNTPMLFDTIWNKFSQQINQQTQQKIVMLGDQLDCLYQQVPMSMLPQFIGGYVDDQDFLNDCQNNQKPKDQNQYQRDNNKSEEQESEEQQQFDFSSLKQALNGMKVGGSHLQSNSQTPLNTEADEN